MLEQNDVLMFFAIDYVTKCLFIGGRCGILPKLSGSGLPLIIDFFFFLNSKWGRCTMHFVADWILVFKRPANIHDIHHL